MNQAEIDSKGSHWKFNRDQSNLVKELYGNDRAAKRGDKFHFMTP